MTKSPYLSICLALICSPTAANEPNYFDLPLEELINVNIYTASQTEESTRSTPATTSVITADQLKQWGVFNLYEALSYLPGIVMNETYMGYSTLTFRGVTPGLYNTKALFMINGQPMNENLFGSSHLETVPLELIERIEVVRSPASALYGTNAIGGVVNVITKTKGKQFKIRGGSNQHHYASLVHHTENFSLGTSTLRDDGYEYGGTLDEMGNLVDFDYNQALDNIYLDYHPEGWRLSLSYFDMEKAKFGLNPIILHHGDNRYETMSVSVKKMQSLGVGTLNISLGYYSQEKELDAENFPPFGNSVTNFNKVTRTSGEIQYKQAIGNSNLVTGISYQLEKSDPMIFIDQTDNSLSPLSPYTDKQDYYTTGLYAQLIHSFTDKLNSVIGLRWEDDKDGGSSGVVPRLGLTYELVSDTFLKILYGEAYRSATFLERYAYVDDILYGNTELEREKIRTTELGINSKIDSKNTLAVTSFYLDLSDEITRRPATPEGTEYYNSPGRVMYGVEVEWKSILSSKAQLDFNVGYTNGEESIFDDAPFIANYNMNIMFNYRLTDRLNVSLTNQTVSSKDYILVSEETGSIDAYNLTNLNIGYQLNKLEFILGLKNLFDEDYTYPEPVRRNVSEIPGGPGRSGYLSASYHY